MTPVPEVAARIGATKDQVRYWASLLDTKPIRKGRLSFLESDTIEQLAMMAAMVNDGITPKEAASSVLARQGRPKPAIEEACKAENLPQNLEREDRLEGMEKAIIALADRIKTLTDQVASLRTENQTLHTRMARIELPNNPPQQVLPWHPPAMKDPMAGKSWWQRAWIAFLSPEQLRKQEVV